MVGQGAERLGPRGGIARDRVHRIYIFVDLRATLDADRTLDIPDGSGKLHALSSPIY